MPQDKRPPARLRGQRLNHVRPITTEHLFAGIPVADRDAAIEWYARFFGRPPDLVPNDREAAWRLTDSGWICLYAATAAGGGASAPHTLLVSDLDAFLADVAVRGIVPGPVETIAPSVRQSVITDPDGNRLKVGHVDEPPAAAEGATARRD
jgi:predicted enzyme related to lactoylglutathione lyase